MDFFQPKVVPDLEQTRRIQSWVRNRLSLGEDTAIMVSELRCSEPGCPPLETVVAVLDGPGRTRQFKFHKPMAQVDSAEIDAAIPRPANPQCPGVDDER